MTRNFSFGNSRKNVLGNSDDSIKYVVHDIDLSATNDSHALIINQLLKNKNKKSVLDVGCNTGSIGIELKKHGYYVDGIEYSKDYFDILNNKKIYNNLYNISVSDFNTSGFSKFYNSEVKYDYIIFADVLEHLVNPDEVIYKLTSKLKPNGKMIISIPNVAHIDIIIGLLNGNFNYSKEGLLDDTHLRFFTASSFSQMIDNIEEKYNIKYELRQFGNTKVIPDYISEKEKDYLGINDKDFEELITIQNLFELSVSKSKQKRIKRNNDQYLKLVNKYYDLVVKNEKLNDSMNKLIAEHNSVINSKWWKLRSKLLFWKKK